MNRTAKNAKRAKQARSWQCTSLALLVVHAGCLLLVGCYGSDRPEIAPVRGQVTYRGKAAAGVTVTFLCTGAPRPAFGTTDAAGNYQLTTFEPGDGAMIGTHVVTVNKYPKFGETSRPDAQAATDSESMNKAIEEAMQRSARRTAKAEKEGTGLPSKYATRQTSDLRAEVVETDNVINIELTD